MFVALAFALVEKEAKISTFFPGFWNRAIVSSKKEKERGAARGLSMQ
jgi:hypothetical protein